MNGKFESGINYTSEVIIPIHFNKSIGVRKLFKPFIFVEDFTLK